MNKKKIRGLIHLDFIGYFIIAILVLVITLLTYLKISYKGESMVKIISDIVNKMWGSG